MSECIAASNASLDTDTAKKLRAERADLLVCAAESCPADVRKECAIRVANVSARLPTIAFSAKSAASADSAR